MTLLALLLDHLWQSTLFVAAAALLVALRGHAPARERHVIWLCASTKFLVPFSALSASGRVAWHAAVAELPGLGAVASWLEPPLRLSVEALALPTARLIRSEASVGVAIALTAVWLAGAFAVIMQRSRAARSVWQIARLARPLASGPESEALHRVLDGRRGHLTPLLVETASALGPGVLGVRRPRIVWPAGLTRRLSAVELEAVLAHEVGHLTRRDNLLAMGHAIVQTVFWFHPLVWWLGARLASERERACDEEVLAMGIDRRTYAGALVKVCGFSLGQAAAALAGAGGGPLAARLRFILSTSPQGLGRRSSPLVLVLFVVATLLTPVGLGIVSASRPPDAAAQGASAGRTTLPRVVHEVKPEYTAAAIRARVQGSVFLAALVTDTGRVGEVRVTRSLDTEHGLDAQAVAAMKQWLFEPGTRDGKPVAVEIEVEMTFRLKD